jgi:hypothetical protein
LIEQGTSIRAGMLRADLYPFKRFLARERGPEPFRLPHQETGATTS